MSSSFFPRFRPSGSRFVAAILGLFALSQATLPRPLFKRTASGVPDTLEVFALYVQFGDPVGGDPPESDANDEPGTTGLGIFGSDKDLSYKLDPNGASIRSSRYYLQKHFDFAQNYFDKVSGGRVVILPRFFPQPDINGRIAPKKLKHRMKAYNPAIEDKPAKQKTKDFESQRAQALMSFVSETAALFNDPRDSANMAFRIAFADAQQNPSPTHHRAFLIFHAGHSRLVDGGTLGFLGADTPNDFTDFLVTKDDFKFLDSATDTFTPTGKPVPERRKDSLGVVISAGDTVTEFMMLSESASQDKVNWGINGILVNQLARQMGMPDLFDVVKGISQVGYFDVMDFAGYNTLDGFLPVFPSAWTRAFMGWDDPVVAARNDSFSEYSLHAADLPATGRTRTVKIPLDEREYLLVENRQRAAGDDTVTLRFSKPSGPTDYTFSVSDSVKVPYAFLDSLFLDSLCTNASCTQKIPNARRPQGIITGASHYDMGLPGNGLLVWHVNEWFLEAFLKEGAVNAYLGDTLRAQYKGLELVEADGIPSIGKEFKDPLGQPAFDYGTAEDMLPHVFRKRRNPPQDTTWAALETSSVIGSTGFSTTNTWNDGRTHIRLVAKPPANPVFARGIGGFTGDSVFTFRDSALALRVYWPADSTLRQPPGSAWPLRTLPAGNPQAVNVIRDGARGGPYVISMGDTGMLQTYTAHGALALAARDTARDSDAYVGVPTLLASGNTRPENAAPVNSLLDPAGAPIGACTAQDSVFAVLTTRTLRLIRPIADSLNGTARTGGREISIPMRGVAGPIAWGGRIWAADDQKILRGFALDGTETDSVLLPARAHALAGILFGSNRDPQIVSVGSGGAAWRYDPVARLLIDLKPAWGSFQAAGGEIFSAVVSDFNRDGEDDVFLLGSKGSGLLFRVDSGVAFAGFPQRFPRSVVFADTAGNYATEDRSAPALADLDGDGRPDILFSGTNAVFAVDWRGAYLPGWPFKPQPRQDVGFAYGNRHLPSTVIGSTPLALSLRGHPAVLLGSPDGLIYAVDSLGKSVSSDWPLSAGGLSIDSIRPPFIHLTLAQLDSDDLELLAQTASGSLNAWSLGNAAARPGQNWLMSGGDPGRSCRLEASTLGTPRVIVDVNSIQDFHLYPSPLRGGIATVYLKIGAPATQARIRVFDLAGNPVKEETLTNLTPGVQPSNHTVDMRRLGPDVYAVLCEVWFASGKKSAWQRIGVVK